jgi:PAS domain S-box-containing protein
MALLDSTAPLADCLHALAVNIETCTQGLLCSILLTDATQTILEPGVAPSLPVAYVNAIGSVPIAVGNGSCGTAAARGETVFVDDIEASALWQSHASTALAHGLRACWSTPIFNGSRVLLGTLALYYRECRRPTASEIELIRGASSLASLVIQRHRDAERLRSSEACLAAAVWGTDIGLWESGTDGKYVWFDDWCDRCDVDACHGSDQERRWCERIHPEDLERYSRVTIAAASGVTDHYVCEYRILSRTGSWRWLHERGKVNARDAGGMAQHFVGVCFCIDDQKRVEAALSAAEQHYELAITAARLPVWEYDVLTDIVTGNSYWHSTVGHIHGEEDASRRVETWLSDIHPDDVERQRNVYTHLATDATGFYQSEFRIRLPTGEYKWLLDRGRVVGRTSDGAPTKVVGISVDIDASKRMEVELRESEERFRGAFDFAPIGMALVAPDGRWLRVNRSLCEMLGYEAQELLAINFQSITHPEDLEADLLQVRRMLDGTLAHYALEKRYVHRAGHTVWVHLSASLVRNAAAKPLYFVSQIQDITKRNRLERALREAAHLEQQRLGQEIHDGLGQELTGLAYLASSLSTEAGRAGSPLADDLAKLADRARRTIQTCRNIARGVSPLTECRGSLVQSVRQIADLAAASGRTCVNFDAIENAALTLASASRDQLHRIAQEAVNNALKHSDADNIRVTIQIDSALVRIKVVDNGRGLNSSDESHSGVGIDGMRQRAATIGARLLVQKRRSGGTLVLCECPQAPSRQAN